MDITENLWKGLTKSVHGRQTEQAGRFGTSVHEERVKITPGRLQMLLGGNLERLEEVIKANRRPRKFYDDSVSDNHTYFTITAIP